MKEKIIVLSFIWGMPILALVGFIIGKKEAGEISSLQMTAVIFALFCSFYIAGNITCLGFPKLFKPFKRGSYRSNI